MDSFSDVKLGMAS